MLKKVLVALTLALTIAASMVAVPQMTGACQSTAGDPCP